MSETLGVGRWEEPSVCLIWKKPWNLRTEEALGVSGERKHNGKLFWILHRYLKTWKKKSLWVLCVCSSGCISLKRGLSEWASSGCAAQHRVCAPEWATGIGLVLKASVIWMAPVEFLPGEVREKSAAGVIHFVFKPVVIFYKEAYFVIFSWKMK